MAKKKYPSQEKEKLMDDLNKHQNDGDLTKFEKALLEHLKTIADVLCDLRYIANGGRDNHFDEH